ncbi:MAG: hypothetical protein HY280_09635 [Nitrospinae bacterium]|nr:hypothetical protein [Nitrospinota bacterium]
MKNISKLALAVVIASAFAFPAAPAFAQDVKNPCGEKPAMAGEGAGKNPCDAKAADMKKDKKHGKMKAPKNPCGKNPCAAK